MVLKKILCILLISFITIQLTMVSVHVRSESSEPLYVMFIWHYHQPWYYSANESYFILPWVRMHSVGNYYKMAYILSKYPSIKVTFTFSGSLITQLKDYVERGVMDVRQIISWKIANGEELTAADIYNMLRIPGGFFDVNWARIVEQIPRYMDLRDRAQAAFEVCVALPLSEDEFIECVANRFTDGNFSSQRIIDLAVMFNLFWMDPEVTREEYPEIYQLMERAKSRSLPEFTRDELRQVLEAHIDIMSKILPKYRQLVSNGQIELIPVPYSHPLAPLIVDFGWMEDLAMHVEKSIELFEEVFNYTPVGMWPAEQAINEYVARIMADQGIQWIASDQSILQKTGINADLLDNYGVPWYFDYDNKRVYLFFRNTLLSNLISFDYANYESADAAVADLINRLESIASQATGPRFVVIALDGENPWEHYEEFGDTFLNKLYQELAELQDQGIIMTTTPREFLQQHSDLAKELPLRNYEYLDLIGKDIADIPLDSYGDAYDQLPRRTVSARLPEGSWGGGELAIWIGDRQENSAWMWLAKAREEVLDALGVDSMLDAYDVNPDVVEYLLRAEASDWFWWYGFDGGGSPETFDPLFKAFMRRAYELAGLTPPDYLNAYFYPDATAKAWFNPDVPKPITQRIDIDGILDPVWTTAIESKEALNISIGSTYISNAYMAVDSEGLMLTFIPWQGADLTSVEIAVYTTTPRRSLSPYNPGYNVYPRYSNKDLGIGLAYEVLIKPSGNIAYVNAADGMGGFFQLYKLSVGIEEVVEIKIPWNYIGLVSGDYSFLTIAVYSGNELVETATRLGLVYRFQVPRGGAAAAAAGNVIIEIEDPVGDDDGAGGYQYPLNPVFKPGVFDMIKFRVSDAGDKLVFEVQVADLGGNPWGGPNGWSLQYVHIYIHTTLPTPGRTDTFGLNINVSQNDAWHIALLLAPGWESLPVPEGQRAALYYYNNTVIVQDSLFKVYADSATNTIVAEVSKSLLFDLDHIDNWSYVVALTSYDGYGDMRIRSFSTEAQDWVVGAPDYAQAILANVIPRVMDLLAPTAEDQYRMLNTFTVELVDNVFTGEYAIVNGINKSVVEAPKVIIKEVTLTETETITETTTETIVTTTTTTTTVPEVIETMNVPLTITFTLLALVIGIAIGYVLPFRKRF